MRIVVAVIARLIEFVNGVAARLANEKRPNRTIYNCADRRAVGLYDIDCFMAMSVVYLIEIIAQLRCFQAFDW